MSNPLVDVADRMAAGPVGISPARNARGPVGIAERPCPFFAGSAWARLGVTPLVLCERGLAGEACGCSFFFCSSSSLACFSRASFSRWDFDKNFG